VAAREVVLYRRPGCHLCDKAEAMLQPLSRRLEFAVRLVDIESDDTLHARYMFSIPVVAFAGQDLLAWPFTTARLEGALREALG
jgi:hypothetical protein